MTTQFKIITFNANGIRSAARKGFFDWLLSQDPDVVCIQESKAQIQQLESDPQFFPLPFCHYHDAEKKGYSGVALYMKAKPDDVQFGIGFPEVDVEGRYIQARFGNVRIISLYMHSGTSGDIRQQMKEAFMAKLLPYLNDIAKNNEKIILCGDINIAHTEKDIKNWKGNLKNSGFLPHERAWLTDLFSQHYCDAFRLLNQNEDEFTWWSQRGAAREKNVGWRIDYQIISNNLKNALLDTYVYREEKFSDHAPLVCIYDKTKLFA